MENSSVPDQSGETGRMWPLRVECDRIGWREATGVMKRYSCYMSSVIKLCYEASDDQRFWVLDKERKIHESHKRECRDVGRE